MRKIILVGAVLFLSACTKLHYTYIAPESEQGKQCVQVCATDKTICEDNYAYDYRKCEDENRLVRLAWDIANKNSELDYHQRNMERNRYTRNCNAISNNCNQNYNACFEACGGRIEVTEY